MNSDSKNAFLPIDAELGVLGSILAQPTAFAIARADLETASFGLEAHRLIFAAAGQLFSGGYTIDLLAVQTVLEKRGELDKVGGRDYLLDALLAASSSESIETHCQIVRADAVRRKLWDTGTQLQQWAKEPDPYQQVGRGVKQLLAIGSRDEFRFESLERIVGGVQDQIVERFENPVTTVGLTTGYHSLDRLCGGFKPGLYIVGGSAHSGKTALALSMSRRIAEKGRAVSIISIEMGKKELGFRLLAMRSGIRSIAIERGLVEENGRLRPLTPEERTRVRQALEWGKQLPIHINDHSAPDTVAVRMSLTQLLARLKVEIVILDYIHLMSERDPQRGMRTTRTLELAAIARNLKVLAKDLEIPIVALAQLSRAPSKRDDHRPELSDLRDSGGIEEAADCVWFPFRPDFANRNRNGMTPTRLEAAEIEISKDRLGGRNGRLAFNFDNEIGEFFEIQKEEASGRD